MEGLKRDLVVVVIVNRGAVARGLNGTGTGTGT